MGERAREGYVDGPQGLRLYWRSDGESATGRPTIVCLNGIGVTMAFFEPFTHRLRAHYRVVRWDYRGHGRSDSPRDPRAVSIETCVDDLEALLRGLGITRPVLIGHSMGGQVSLEYYRRHPDDVAALIPTLATAGRTLETFFDTRASLAAFAAVKAIVRAAPGIASAVAGKVMLSGLAERGARLLGIVDHALAPHPLMVSFMEQLARMDLRTYVSLGQSLQDHDATDLLPQIRVPTLVVAGEKDCFTPIRLAHQMARAIPGAELLVIPNGTHAALIEQPELLALRVEQFVEDRVAGAAQPSTGS